MIRRRGRKKGMSTFAAGLIALVAIVVFTYLGFTKFANPFASQYTVHAIFSNATAVKKGGPSYNASIKYWLPAYEYSAVVAHDALGLQTHDLSNWIAEQGEVSGAIDTHPQNLQNLITNFNTTAHAFAVQNVALSQAVAELPKTLAAAIPAFHSLNAAFCSGAQVPNCAPGPLPQLAKALI